MSLTMTMTGHSVAAAASAVSLQSNYYNSNQIFMMMVSGVVWLAFLFSFKIFVNLF
jgi:hypothetical protein